MEAATATPIRHQLSLDVGGDAAERIDGSLSISGKVVVGRDLARQEDLEIHVFSKADGELIATGDAVVASIKFVDQSKDGFEWVERQHTAKIQAE